MFSYFLIRNAPINECSSRQRKHFEVFSERRNLWKFSINCCGVIVLNTILELNIDPDIPEAVSKFYV